MNDFVIHAASYLGPEGFGNDQIGLRAWPPPLQEDLSRFVASADMAMGQDELLLLTRHMASIQGLSGASLYVTANPRGSFTLLLGGAQAQVDMAGSLLGLLGLHI